MLYYKDRILYLSNLIFNTVCTSNLFLVKKATINYRVITLQNIDDIRALLACSVNSVIRL